MPEPMNHCHVDISLALISVDDLFVMQLRDLDSEIPDPGTWGFFAGHCETGERPRPAMLRELREELSWQPELLVFLGAFKVWSWITALAVFAIVITAGYILWMLQRAFFGPLQPRFASIGDATVIEAVPMVILVVAIMLVGVYPSIVLDVFRSGIDPIIYSLQQVAGG